MSENPSPSEGRAHDLNYAVCNLIAGGCGKQKSVEKFRVGGTICLACEGKSAREESEIRELAKHQRSAAREIGKRLLEDEKRRRLGLPPTSHVLNLIISKFGGYEAYADWCYRNAIGAEEGSKTANDAAHRLMTVLIEANRQEMGSDVGNMDDEELATLVGQFAMHANERIIDVEPDRIEQQDAEE